LGSEDRGSPRPIRPPGGGMTGIFQKGRERKGHHDVQRGMHHAINRNYYKEGRAR